MGKGIALVTGASSGIGLATATRLNKDGYQVYGTSRRGVQAGKYPFEMLTLDVTDDQSVSSVVEELMKSAGRIDLLVNNAGVGVGLAADEETSIEQTKAMFETNFFGTVRMTRAVVPHMRRQGSGRIINIGSGLGILPMPYVAIYSATKHAIEGYSEALDHELRNWGVRVLIVEPGMTRTPFDANVKEPDLMNEEYGKIRADLNKRHRELLAKGDSPETVAEVVLKAANALQPKLRYPVGSMGSVSLLRRFAPGLVESGLRKQLGLEAFRPTASQGAK